MEKYTLTHEDTEKIKNLMVGRIIIQVQNDTLVLDDLTKLRIIPNSGCGGCENGYYELAFLNHVHNVITNVEFNEEMIDNKPEEYPMVYSIYVYTDALTTAAPLAEITGNDGNGYYGTGYRVDVIVE